MRTEPAMSQDAVMTDAASFAIALELAGPLRDGGAPRLAIKQGDRIAAMGDSITQNGGYLRAIQAVFTQQYPELNVPPIVNAGISGHKAEDMVARFERDVVRHAPTVTTISAGINDVWHRLEAPHDEKVLAQFGRNLERMVHLAIDAGSRVFLLSPTVIEEDRASEGNRRLARYVESGKSIAREHGCTYVDLHALFLHAVDRQADDARLGLAGPLTRDGVHMNPLGDVLMAVGVLRAVGVADEKMEATNLNGAFPAS